MNSKKSPEGGLNRRDLLKVIGAAVPGALISPAGVAAESMKTPTPSGAAPAEGQAAASKLQALTEHEWKTVRLLSDLILPADERSGSASEAGVPGFIDDWLAFRGGDLLAEIRGGLTWLDLECNRLFRRDFVDCSADQQKQILDRIAYPKKAAPEDTNAVAFFNQLRDLVVSGFYTSKEGIKDLPYLGNQMVTEWKGCPPEVLAKLGVSYDGTKS
ncbi:MAG: gluconate 2-dehydrogenase subunit 3 family protein [Terriglobia bacterium]